MKYRANIEIIESRIKEIMKDREYETVEEAIKNEFCWVRDSGILLESLEVEVKSNDVNRYSIPFNLEELRDVAGENKTLDGVNNIYDLELFVVAPKNIVQGIALVTINTNDEESVRLSVFNACLDTLDPINSIDDVGYTDIEDIRTFELSKKGYDEAKNLYGILIKNTETFV